MPTTIEPDIEGLARVEAGGSGIFFPGDGDLVDQNIDGGDYNCDSGPDLEPPTGCPAPGPTAYSYSRTFHHDAESFSGSGIFANEIHPPPDLALVALSVGVDLFPYTIGCRTGVDGDDPGFGCHTPAVYDEATITIEHLTSIGAGVADFHPVTGWTTLMYNPGRSPDYFDSFDYDNDIGAGWSQGGGALIRPPSPAYTDPDPLDPMIEYVPFLWRWRDIVDTTVSLIVDGGEWHRVFAEARGLSLTIVPYRYLSPPAHSASGWMHVL
jgi:hypothetical protein